MTTVYAWPTTSAFLVRDCSIYLEPNTRGFTSPYTNGFQSIDLMGERLHMSISMAGCTAADGAQRQAYWNRLRLSNWISAYHFARKKPYGTQRGTPTLLAAVAQGASALPMTGGTSGATFLPGDMLGCGGQLFEVADAVTFDGSGHATVNVSNRVRSVTGIAISTAVLWDKPTTNWRLASSVAVLFTPDHICGPLDVELIETW